MRQFQRRETPILLAAANTAQRILLQDDRRVYCGFWAPPTASSLQISSSPGNFSSFSGQAPLLVGSTPNGPIWEMYRDRHGELCGMEWWIFGGGMPGTYVLTTIELLAWDDGRTGLIVGNDFANDPHILIPGVDSPDELTQLVGQLKALKWKR